MTGTSTTTAPAAVPARRGALARLFEPLNPVAASGAGVVVAVVTAVFYLMGSGRSLDYDSSLTVGAFVKTPSLIDPLRRQIQLNNHPLFSVFEHIVWSAGFHTETALRVLPILFGVLTVAVLTAWCAHLWGVLPGLSAGAVVAANPMFQDLARAVRGYSLLTFTALIATLLLWRLLDEAPASRAVEVFYVGFLAAGISTHLYGCTVVLVHAVIVIVRHRVDGTWVRRWLLSGFLGGLIYLKTIKAVLNTHNGRVFHGEYGRELALAVLGQARLAAGLLALVVLGALWLARRRLDLLAGVAAILVFVGFVWFVLQPQFLEVRYWDWIIPGVGLAAAFLTSRKPIALVVVAVAIGALVVHDGATWTATEVPTAQTAALVDAARGEGLRVCGVEHTAVAVLAYTPQPARVAVADQLAQCDFVVGFYVTNAENRAERQRFPYRWKVPGEIPAFVYSNRAEASVTAGMTVSRLELASHPHTYPK